MTSKSSSSSSILHLLLHEEGESATSLDEDDFGIAVARPSDQDASTDDDAQQRRLSVPEMDPSENRSTNNQQQKNLALSIMQYNQNQQPEIFEDHHSFSITRPADQIFVPFVAESAIVDLNTFSCETSFSTATPPSPTTLAIVPTDTVISENNKKPEPGERIESEEAAEELFLLVPTAAAGFGNFGSTGLETITTPTVVTITTATAALHNSNSALDSLCQPFISPHTTVQSSASPEYAGDNVERPHLFGGGQLLPTISSSSACRNTAASNPLQLNLTLNNNKRVAAASISPPIEPTTSNKTSPNDKSRHHHLVKTPQQQQQQRHQANLASLSAVLRTKNVGAMFLSAQQPYTAAIGGPRNISGDDFHWASVLGRITGGGSARDLNREFLTSTNHETFKRWSLAGANNPELALLRVKLEDVQHELGDLRAKHESTLNDYQGLLRQMEFFQDEKTGLETRLQAAASEVFRLCCENNRLTQQKCLTDRQAADLQLQLQRTQKERDEIVAGRSNADDFACKLMEELDDLRLDRDNLRNTCSAVETDCAELKQTLMMAREDNRVMRLQYENQLEVQRIKMQTMEMSQNDAHQRYQKLAQERDLLRANLDIWHQDLEDNISNNARLQNILHKREEELRELQLNYKKLSVEYDRLMSERNDVLQENARLIDGTGRQELLDQVSKLQIQLKNMQMQQQTSHNNKFVVVAGTNGANGFNGGGDAEASEDEMILISGQAQQHQQQAQLDEMRRRMESLNQQYESTCQELEKAKQSREWAMTERTRILAERDSMRTMCDELRRDRDSAVTKLADAYKDTEELQRSKEQAEREVKKMRERLELDLKTKMPNPNSSPSNSRDSAIDNDLAEWEIETLTINIVCGQKGDEIGLELGGGRDDLVGGNTVPIYVKSVEAGSSFDGVLRVYDCINQVNNIDVANMERRSVIDILKNSNSGVMVIKRRRLVGMKLISVTLDSSNDKDFGILFEDGVYVTKIKPSSVAAKSSSLAVGDRLVYVNDIHVQNKSAAVVQDILQNLKGSCVVLAVMKSPPVLSPMTPSASLLSSASCSNTTAHNVSSSSSRSAANKNLKDGNGNVETGFTGHQQFYTSKNNAANLRTAFKDEYVQTTDNDFAVVQAYSAGTPTHTKKESLLNKVHDKFFGKNEKKSTVRASASIPNDFDDSFLRSMTVVAVNRNNRRKPGYSHTGSERASSAINRYSKQHASILSSGGIFTPPLSKHQQQTGNSGNNKNYPIADEQEVLQGLDRILEASEKEEYPNKLLTKVISSEKNASGGTWPKSRPTPLISPLCNDPGTSVPPFPISPAAQAQARKPSAKQRRNVLPFFGHGSRGGGNVNDDKSDFSPDSENFYVDASSPVKNCNLPIDMRLVDCHNTAPSKMRCHETNRPMSYHPAIPNLHPQQHHYMERGGVGGGVELSLMQRDSSFHSVMPPPPANNVLSRPSTNSAFDAYHRSSCGDDESSPLMRCNHSNTMGRMASVQSTARRQKVVSQYEPVYANVESMSSAMATVGRRQQQQQQQNHLFGKRPTYSNAPPRYRPPPPTNTATISRFSPLPSSVQVQGQAIAAAAAGTSSLEQDIDAQSITSQSSGFSRCGFMNKNNNCYNSRAAKNEGLNKSNPIGSFKSYADDATLSSQAKYSQGDVRNICLEKRSSEGLGINWKCSGSGTGGVFISSVSENSIAAKHGIQVGDQLLEVCGINMRTADYYYAKNVLSSIPQDEIRLLVQYNPDRYFRDPTLTPCATPSSIGGSNSYTKLRDFSLQGQNDQWNRTTALNMVVGSNLPVRNQTRMVKIEKETADDWGFSIIGGNAVGIFIDGIRMDSHAYNIYGLRNGDQILEFDGADFQKLTLEQAMNDLRNRTCDVEISILVQYNEQKYQKCKACIAGGDSFYIRAHVDRKEENTDELSFKTGDVLRVDNTVFNGVIGLWRAWLVDQEGRERSCGIIPSKARLEEEYLNKIITVDMSASDGNSEGGGSRRGTIRRSLKFIRRSSRTNQHQRTSSKDSRDLQDTNAFSDELYQRVERIDDKKKRPVLILGALADKFIAKLLEDYPRIFAQCVPECVQPDSSRKLEHGLQTRLYVDYRKRDKLFEVTTVSAVNEIIEKGFYCILHVNTAAVARLRSLHIYPIVIFVKFKNAKQIKEVSEDDISGRQAKEMFEQAERTEIEFRHLFSTVVQGPHSNVKYFCQQIASAVDHEQKKTLWVPSNESL